MPIKHWTLRLSGIPKSNPADIHSEIQLYIKKLLPETEKYEVKAIDIISSCKNRLESIALIDLIGDLPKDISETKYAELFGASVVVDSKFLGLTQLYDGPNEELITADIIAITGLGGHAYNSWRGRENPNFMWLRHALKKDMASCRTMTYGYESQLSAYGISRLLEYGRAFLDEVEKVRRTAAEIKRPLLVIGHSYGGLLLAQSIIESYMRHANETMTASTTLHQASYGFVFFAVPHRGMIVDDIAQTLGESHPRNALFRQIAQNPEQTPDFLEKQLDHFRELLQHRKVVTVYEQLQSRKLERQENGALLRTGERMMIMSPESAILGLINQSEKKIPSMRDHSDVAKFDSAQDTVLETVLRSLQDFNEKAPATVKKQFQSNEQAWFHQRQQKYNEVVRWLSPQEQENDHYEDELEDARSSRHSGTCRWILARPEYDSWLNAGSATESLLLWICAIPGAGKTVLASYIIDQVAQKLSDNSQNILYFFFKNTDKDKNTPLAAAKALLHQLLQFDDRSELLGDLQNHMEASSQPRTFNFKLLWGLFCKHCPRLCIRFILLDALDECDNISLLLPGLTELSQRYHIKLIFTGREQDLITELNGLPVLRIRPNDVADDIEAFSKYQISERPNLSDRRVRPRIIRTLNSRNKGMFLWVALMIQELDSLSSIEEIDHSLSSLPEDLPEMYERILKRLDSKLKPSKRLLCTRLLRWIVLAKRPLQVGELRDALRLDYAMTSDGFGFVQNFLCSPKELELICGSLVTIKSQTIQLIHFSTKEFILNTNYSSRLETPLREFFVDVSSDSAYVADRLLFVMSDWWKSTSMLIQFDDDVDDGVHAPFFEYACLNWVSHIIESKTQYARRYAESMNEFVLSYQSWWTWIEFCLKIQPDCVSQLKMQVQSLLEWTGHPSAHFENVWNDWAESMLRILEDYGMALQREPYRVHTIDPSQIKVSGLLQSMDSRVENSPHERHTIIGPRDTFLPISCSASNRQLPKHTSRKDEYGFLNFDRGRNAFIFLDKYPGGSCAIECQEAGTWRRALPVTDPELQDDTWQNITVAGAAMSPDSRYLGIVYDGSFSKTSAARAQSTFYTVVWMLQSPINFTGASSAPWAKKVISLTATTNLFSKSSCIISFTAENILCCPNGFVDVVTGEDQRIPGLSNSELARWDINNFSFGGCTRDVFFIAGGLDVAIGRISLNGDIHEITRMQHTFSPKLVCISRSGRFIIWRQSSDQFSYDKKYCIYDTMNSKYNDLNSPHIEDPPGPVFEKFVFTRGDKQLFGVIQPVSTDSGLITSHLFFWDLEHGSYDIRGKRILREGLLGCCIDEEEQKLYIVNLKRVWSSYNLATPGLCGFHDEEGEVTSLDRMDCKVSGDGKRLALLRFKNGCVYFQLFELSNINNVAMERTLDLPAKNYDDALVIFCANLECLFIGDVIVNLRQTDSRIMFVPIKFLTRATKDKYDQTDGWSGSFDARSQYLALFSYPVDRKTQSADLHIFSIGNDVIDEMTFPDLDLTPYERLDVQFHLYWFNVLLLSGQKRLPRYERETQCRLLNLVTGELEDLGSQSHPRRCFSPAYFSACGSYVVKRHDIVELFWPMPSGYMYDDPSRIPIASSIPKIDNVERPPSPSSPLFNEMKTNEIYYWTSFEFRLSVPESDLVLSIRCLRSGKAQSKTMTMIPKYLEHAEIHLIMGDVWSAQSTKVLFLSDGKSTGRGRTTEMKELNLTMQDFLLRYDSWRQREEWGDELRSRVLSEPTLTELLNG